MRKHDHVLFQEGIIRLNNQSPSYSAHKCLNDNNCCHFNIYEQNKCFAMLS